MFLTSSPPITLCTALFPVLIITICKTYVRFINFKHVQLMGNTYKYNNSRVVIQQQYAFILMDNDPIRTKICVTTWNYICIIITEFCNFGCVSTSLFFQTFLCK
jgi:hypothetical protein